VEGERVMMRPGDFVTTPGWTWHAHGNVGSEPVVWLDGLDTAFANLFGAHFREDYPQESQPVTRRNGDAGARYGANLLPLEYRPRGGGSPLLSYPYDRTREALGRPDSGDRIAAMATSCATSIPVRRASVSDHGSLRMAAGRVPGQALPQHGRRCILRRRGGPRRYRGTSSRSPRTMCRVPSWKFHQLQADRTCSSATPTARAGGARFLARRNRLVTRVRP
jgi:hypothetical protein